MPEPHDGNMMRRFGTTATTPGRERTAGTKPSFRAEGASGVTVIELLVFMALFGLLLGIATSYFRQQSRVSTRTQAGNELAINTRLAAEVISQDLQVSGSDVIFTRGDHLKVALPCGALTFPKCVTQPNEPSTGNTFLQMHYVTQTRPSEPCRRVSFRLAATTLERSDVACAAASDQFVPFVEDVSAIDVSWRCSNPDLASVTDPEDVVDDCYAVDGSGELISFPRIAIVEIQSVAASQQDVESSIRFSALTPNLRE